MENFSLGNAKLEDHQSEHKEDFLFPPGDYRGRITRCYYEKFDTLGWVLIDFVIVDGKCKGKEFTKFFQLNPRPDKDVSEKRLQFERGMLGDLCRAAGLAKFPQEWEELVGEQMILSLSINHWQGTDRTQVDHFKKDEQFSKITDQEAPPAPAGGAPAEEDFDDDIPF